MHAHQQARRYVHRSLAIHMHFYHGQIEFPHAVYRIAPGDVTVSPEAISTEYQLEENGWHYCLHLRSAQGRTRGQKVELPWHLAAADFAQPQLFEQVIRWHHDQRALAQRAAVAAFQQLLLALTLAREALPQSSEEGVPGAVQQLRRILDARFHETQEVAALCHEVGTARHRLTRAFHRATGRTILGYVQDRRLDHAAALLEATDARIKEIADRCGFYDIHHLNKAFRGRHQCSPGQWRQRHQN